MKIDPEERDRLLAEGGRFVYRELLSHALAPYLESDE